MNYCWRNEHKKSSITLIGSEIAIKMDYTYTSKDFYTFVLKDKDILKVTKTKKYLFKLK